MVVGGHGIKMKRSEEGEVKSYQPSALGSSGQRKFKREKQEYRRILHRRPYHKARYKEEVQYLNTLFKKTCY